MVEEADIRRPTATNGPVRIYGTPERGPLRSVIATGRDFSEGLRRHQVWLAFAWDEVQNRYRRSIVGLGWIGLSFLIFVAAISIFFGAFSGLKPQDYIAYVSFGFAVFQFLMGNVVDGCSVFTRSASWLKGMALPYSVYVYKGVARSLLPLAIYAILAVALLPLFGWRPTAIALWSIPAVVLLVLTAIPVQWVFGLLAARWRDVSHFIAAIARIFLFSTPIIWVYDETEGIRRTLADINPFTHFVQIVRQPLLGEMADSQHIVGALFWTVAAWVVAFVAGALMRRQLPFWV
ncbi:MAG: ABC transporter permease [Pseudomonadota bacterium]